MNVIYITAGSGRIDCDACLRDGALAKTLMAKGCDVLFVPTYTPHFANLGNPFSSKSTWEIGAAVAVRSAIDKLGGRVLVMGTPSEEVCGCKETMAKRGAFADVDAAMMVHPGTRDIAGDSAERWPRPSRP